MFRIMGKYKNSGTEEVDTASTQEEADYLLGEYRLAFRGWTLWIE